MHSQIDMLPLAPCTASAVNRLADLTAVPKHDGEHSSALDSDKRDSPFEDPSMTESKSVINSSMQVEPKNESGEAPPPPNQQGPL